MASFKFSCPHCGKHVEAEEEWGGAWKQNVLIVEKLL